MKKRCYANPDIIYLGTDFVFRKTKLCELFFMGNFVKHRILLNYVFVPKLLIHTHLDGFYFSLIKYISQSMHEHFANVSCP